MSIPSRDLSVARARNLRFKATWRAARGKKWLPLRDDIPSLEEAYQFALSQDCPEVALWVKTLSGNSLYWGSDDPELFNSLALQEGYS